MYESVDGSSASIGTTEEACLEQFRLDNYTKGARPAPGGPEGLRDAHPLRGHRPGYDQVGVVGVTSLGHNEAELDGRARHGIARGPTRPTSTPRRTASSSMNTGTSARRGPGDEAVGQRADTDVRDLTQRRRRRPRRAERIGDVLPVRPRLHDASGERRRDAHLGPVPRDARARIERAARRSSSSRAETTRTTLVLRDHTYARPRSR